MGTALEDEEDAFDDDEEAVVAAAEKALAEICGVDSAQEKRPS